MKVGVLSHVFTGWGGGIDFIRHMLSYLDEIELDHESFSKTLILSRDDVLVRLKNIAYPLRKLIEQAKEGKRLSWEKRPRFSASYLENTFSYYSKKNEIVFSGSTIKSQLQAAIDSGVDVVFPCFVPPSADFQLPWVGYIADFQHRHIPEFFSSIEIKYRDNAFSKMLNTAKHIIVYGQSIIEDAECFYPGHSAKLHALPFSPYLQERWLISHLDVRETYNLMAPYFIICNQFWRHKDHITALKAFSEYCANGGQADLVCTGDTVDYRFPKYFDNIQILIRDLGLVSRVRILGHIPKDHQIALLKKALAVLQPTLSEGGPGGGSSYDAISLGVPVIASNIPINLEMTSGDVTFFKSGNFIHLAEMMALKSVGESSRESNEFLLERGRYQRKIASHALKNILCEALGREL
jgi:glycosyltransferase involved in cell wall biosynthesis